MSLRLYWYKSKNFGDALSPMLVAKLSGQNVEWSPMPFAELAAIGSVLFAGSSIFVSRQSIMSLKGWLKLGQKCLDRFCPTLNIWGSGFLFDEGVRSAIKVRHCNVCAVRGAKSLAILSRVAVKNNGVALGDPGLLYPMLLNKSLAKEWDIGVVPHFSDYEAGVRYGEELRRKGLRVKVVDVLQDDPIQTVYDIGSCEKVVSSSLHGLIVADAFGIPRMHKVWSTIGQSDDDFLFKFEDYGTSIGVEEWEYECIDKFFRASSAVDDAKEGLLRSFPKQWFQQLP